MSNDSIDYADLRKFIEQLQQNTQISDTEIRRLVMQQVEEAVAQKRAAERKEIEREVEIYSEELVRDPEEERARARDRAKSAALLLIMLLLILLLIAAATGRTDILQFQAAQATPTLEPRISTSNVFPPNYQPPTPAAQPAPQVDQLFRDYYYTYGGPAVFGDAISPLMQDNGRSVQWFQRARLEYWPELAAQGYPVQSSLIGARYIDQEKIQFPTQLPFVSQDRVLYFRETGHGLSDIFLDYWNAHNGMRVLGMPISDQLQETLSDNRSHTVQYFERGRLEYHPENGSDPQMMLGLLGQRLYANPDKSKIIAPTPVPLPPSAAPTPVPVAN